MWGAIVCGADKFFSEKFFRCLRGASYLGGDTRDRVTHPQPREGLGDFFCCPRNLFCRHSVYLSIMPTHFEASSTTGCLWTAGYGLVRIDAGTRRPGASFGTSSTSVKGFASALTGLTKRTRRRVVGATAHRLRVVPDSMETGDAITMCCRTVGDGVETPCRLMASSVRKPAYASMVSESFGCSQRFKVDGLGCFRRNARDQRFAGITMEELF